METRGGRGGEICNFYIISAEFTSVLPLGGWISEKKPSGNINREFPAEIFNDYKIRHSRPLTDSRVFLMNIEKRCQYMDEVQQ